MINWLVANKDLISIAGAFFSPVVVAVIALVAARRSKDAIDALALKDATIENLRLKAANLEERIRCIEDAIRGAEENERIATDIANSRQEAISSLQDKTSELERYISEHPHLVWRRNFYREAFPEDENNSRYFCAECWDERRVYSVLKTARDSMARFGACKNEDCSLYNNHW